MIRLLTDENVKAAILRGLRRRLPGVDIVTAQQAGLRSTEDRLILEWAARENRVILTHDLATMVPFAYQRIAAEAIMAGVLAVPWSTSIGRSIDFVATLIEAGTEEDFLNAVFQYP